MLSGEIALKNNHYYYYCNYSNINRLNIENRIIFKLGILSPLGLNTKFYTFSLTYIVITQLFSPVEGFMLKMS